MQVLIPINLKSYNQYVSENQMKLTLNDAELKKAVGDFIYTLGFDPDQVEVTAVDFTAGRGANGYSAEVEIEPRKASNSVPDAPVKRTVVCKPEPEVVEDTPPFETTEEPVKAETEEESELEETATTPVAGASLFKKK